MISVTKDTNIVFIGVVISTHLPNTMISVTKDTNIVFIGVVTRE